MTVRAVEWKQPYTWGQAIEIDENKVINLRLRAENNLIIYDGEDDEIYVDLQLPDEITPTDAFPVWVTTGRVIVDNGWDAQGTIICAKTTSGDNIKILYEDNWTLWMDNGTWTFKQIYFKADVDLITSSLQEQIDVLSWLGKFLSLWDCAGGEPMSFPLETPYEYSTWDYYLVGNVSSATPPVNYRPTGSEWDDTPSQTAETEVVEIGDVYIYDWTVWLLQKNSPSWGTGNVVWPNSATDWHIAVFNWATGKIIRDWWPIPTWDVGVSTDTGTLLTAWVELWLWTETDFSGISTPDANTMYIQYTSDSPTPPAPRTPWVNTLAYYKINDNDTTSTIYDLSWNWVDQTWSGTGSYTTDATYGRVAVFDGSVYTEASSKVNFGSECTFIALFLRDNTTNQHSIVVECASSSAFPIGIACDTPSKYTGYYAGSWFQTPFKVDSTSSATANQWVMIATTRASDGTAKLYINWVLDSTESWMNTPNYSSWNNLRIWNWRDNYYQLEWKFKLFIWENRTWTDQEIADLATEYGFTVS